MALKNGCYLPVHFTDEMKLMLEKFADELKRPQSKVCEMILQIELPKYVEHFEKRKEIDKWES